MANTVNPKLKITLKRLRPTTLNLSSPISRARAPAPLQDSLAPHWIHPASNYNNAMPNMRFDGNSPNTSTALNETLMHNSEEPLLCLSMETPPKQWWVGPAGEKMDLLKRRRIFVDLPSPFDRRSWVSVCICRASRITLVDLFTQNALNLMQLSPLESALLQQFHVVERE